jgi:hypothetical protein
MTERVTKAISARGLTNDDVIDRLNREIVPTLIELRQRFNELLSPPTTAVYTVTNPVVRRTFDTTTVTLSQLAEVVGTIIADLKTAGVLE